ncbi:VCBS repeat-containing protein, partial [bacterium]|nr:VCBS repeat-containing protein [bacterium]
MGLLRTLRRARRRSALRLEYLEDRVVPDGTPGLGYGPAPAPDAVPVEWQGQTRLAAPGRWLVQADGLTGTPAEQAAAFSQTLTSLDLGVRVESHLGPDGLFLLSGPADLTAQALAGELGAAPNVRFVEPDFYEASAQVTPNDPSFNQLWGMNNTGSNPGVGTGVPDADIDAPEAWDLTAPSRGSTQVVVAVDDSGVDYTHPDLYLNVWLNQTEIPAAVRPTLADTDGDGLITFWDLNAPANAGRVADNNLNGRIDAGDVLRPTGLGGWMDSLDGNAVGTANGFVDDLVGWDFFNNDNNPDDEWSGVWHGTHVAGTIGAIGNNSVGVTGVNWKTQIMIVRGLGPTGSGPYSALLGALDYAVDNGAKLSNHSWGGSAPSSALEASVVNARNHGHLMVVAAGNGGIDGFGDNLDNPVAETSYPAVYPYDNIITVANTTNTDAVNSSSNYGLTSVDLGAPGTNVLSTMSSTRGPAYGYLSGTSMATPHVAGTAALMLSLNPTATYTQVRNAIFQTVDPITALRTNGPTPVATGGRLNAARAVQAFGFAVAATTPAVGSSVPAAPTAFVVDLTQPYDPASVQASDFVVNGIAATGVTVTDADTLKFTFAASPVTAEGVQTMTVAAGALAALANGTAVSAFTGTFRYDTVPLAVAAVSPAPGVVPAPFTFLDVTFNEPLDPNSAQAADLTLSRGTVVGAEVLAGTGGRVVRYALSGLTTSGPLTVTLGAAALADAAGNPGPAAAVVLQYVLNAPATVFPVPLTALPPLGSLAYTGSAVGAIATPGELDPYALSVDAGQSVTVTVSPTSVTAPSSLLPTVELRDPSGAVVASAVAPAVGQPAVIQVAAAALTGTYTITVGGAAGAGAYTVAVYLNAAVEAESVGGAANNTRATAQDVGPAFLGLQAGSAASRAAVQGQLSPATGDDFYALPLAAGQPVTLALGLSSFNAAPAFASTRTDVPVPAGRYPIFVGYRDLNGDGRQDMVAVVNDGGTDANSAIGVRLGNGDGTFGALAQYPAGTVFARFLDFGDVNGDGKTDVVMSSDRTPQVSLFLGNGDGTFQAVRNTQAPASGLGVAVGDLNADGRADAVVANFNGFVSVLLGQANGTLGAPAVYFTNAGGTFTATLGDVNGDGRLDVVTGNFNSASVSVMLGNGTGAFGSPLVLSAAPNTWGVALGDLNGDGRLDLVAANQGAGNVMVRPGNGDGTFGNPAFFSTGGSGPRTVVLSDVNGDGRLDAVAVNIGSASVSVLPGNGNGTFGAALAFPTGSNPNSATVADLNGDGFPDLSSADAASGSISVRLNTTPSVRLEVQDAVGNVVATATRGPTNYDRGLTFTPAAGGTYYVRVFGTNATTPYTLVATRAAAFDAEANDSAATAQPLGAAGGALGAITPGAPVGAVVPAASTNADANFNNSFPFNIGGFGIPSMRYQQIYAASQFGGAAGVIDALRFRQDAGYSGTFTATLNVKITLGYAARTTTTASPVFADNIGAGTVTVLDGLVTISSTASGANPRPFDVVIDVANLFRYDPAQGDLLVDISLRNSPAFFIPFDAVIDAPAVGVTTRIYQTDVNAPVGQGAFAGGLVTRFDLATASDDWYAVDLAAGQRVELTTATPGGGPGEFVNALNPRVELYDPAGNRVAVGTPLLDNRNERIAFAAPAAGTYRVRITGENNTAGEYFLGANFNPVTADDAVTTPEDTPVGIAVLANDGDDTPVSQGTVSIVTGPAHGTVSVSAAGVVTYTPDADYSGPDGFTYTVTDAGGAVSNVAAVGITVDAVADAPALTVTPAAGGDETAPIPLDLAAALTDTDGSESLAITVAGVPAGGVLSAGTDNGDGTWTLTPAQLTGLTITLPDNPTDDAPFTLTVTATATESSNGSTAPTSAGIEVTVRNVAPTAALTAPATGTEGSPVTVSLDGATDVSPVDVAAGLEYAFDFGTGYGAFGAGNAATFTPADNGTYTVRAKVRDKDGGETEYTTTVEVANASPTPTIASVSTPWLEGTAITATGGATDPAGANDTVTLSWAVYKTGAAAPFATGTGAGVTFTPDDNGSYRVVLTASDEDGGSASTETTVAVDNVAPQNLTIAGPGSAVRGQPVTYSGLFTDPGSADTHTLAWQATRNGTVVATG